MGRITSLLAVLGALAAPGALAQPAAAVAGLRVEGTEIVVELTDGRQLRSRDLAGAELDVRLDGAPARLRLVAVEPDPLDRSGSIWLHLFEAAQPDGSWANPCMPGPDGRRQGFPLQGPGGLEFTCTAGALAKCARMGFRPWATGTDGRSLAPLHAACVRMVRADYGGDGTSWTRDGTLIDVYDDRGIQSADADPAQAFEAGWGPEGAVCVHHARVAGDTSLAALEARYPHLRGRTGTACTEAAARAAGALLFNRSGTQHPAP